MAGNITMNGNGFINAVNIGVTGLNANTTPNIKFSSIASHIDNNIGEVYLFTGYQGHIAIGRDTNRNTTTTNLVLGTADTQESEIISVNTTNTAYQPLSFASSKYVFTNGNAGFNQSKPQYKIHASRTNAYNDSTGGYSGNKAIAILGIGGKDNDPDYQYIVYPNPSQTDGSISGLQWWSADMLTGRYKNEFRLAWWKETHGTPLGSAYKEGITMFLS